MSDFINDFSKQLIDSGLCSSLEMRGCWDFEIRDLENHFDINLPVVYKDFLKKMGKGAGRFMQGTDIFYKHLFDNRTAIEEILKSEEYPFILENKAFVFSSHQGYIFHFFNILEDISDPPVYSYEEGEQSFKLITENFSTFLLLLLKEETTVWSSGNH